MSADAERPSASLTGQVASAVRVIASAACGDWSSDMTCFARVSSSSNGASNPCVPWLRIAVMPPASVETTGSPQAYASRIDVGMLSMFGLCK